MRRTGLHRGRQWGGFAALALTFTLASVTASAENRTIPEPPEVPQAASTALRPEPILREKSFRPKTPEERLAQRLAKSWAGRRLRRGTTAIYVVDNTTGKPIFAVHEKQKLNPASNVKLFSTAAALDILGPEWRYITRLFGPSPGVDGIAEGDLYILGTADPTLRTNHLDDLVEQVKTAGIERITGDVVIGSRTIRDAVARARIKVTVIGQAPGKPPLVRYQPESDLFRVVLDARSLRKRRGRARIGLRWVEVEDDSDATDAADESDGEAPKTPATSNAAQGEAEDASATGAPAHNHYELRVSGTIRRGRRATVYRTVSRRATFTAYTLKAKLEEAGIEVGGGVRIEEIDDAIEVAANAGYLPVELARHQSRSISHLLARVNKPSNNYLADRVLMTAGAAVYGGIPTMEKGLDALSQWLERDAGLDAKRLTIDTGSGLSYNTEITAEQIVHVLRAGAGLVGPDPDGDDEANAPVFLKSLAVAGRDGTLRRRFRRSHTRGKMVGKTGTLTRVIALSGFVKDRDDDDGLCFAIVTNGHRHNLRNRVRREHERLVEAMHHYLRERRELASQ